MWQQHSHPRHHLPLACVSCCNQHECWNWWQTSVHPCLSARVQWNMMSISLSRIWSAITTALFRTDCALRRDIRIPGLVLRRSLSVWQTVEWYVLMHKGGSKLNLNINIAGRFLPETYTSTDTSWASMPVSSHVHHTDPGSGRLSRDQVNKMTGYESKLVLWIWQRSESWPAMLYWALY